MLCFVSYSIPNRDITRSDPVSHIICVSISVCPQIDKNLHILCVDVYIYIYMKTLTGEYKELLTFQLTKGHQNWPSGQRLSNLCHFQEITSHNQHGGSTLFIFFSTYLKRFFFHFNEKMKNIFVDNYL